VGNHEECFYYRLEYGHQKRNHTIIELSFSKLHQKVIKDGAILVILNQLLHEFNK